MSALIGWPARDPAALARFCEGACRRVVAHAAKDVPFYRDKLGASVPAAAGGPWPGLLAELPLTERVELQACPVEKRVAAGLDVASLRRRRTSGTTGRPLTILRTPFEEDLLLALRVRARMSLGYSPHQRLVRVGIRRSDEPSSRRWHEILGLARREVVDVVEEGAAGLRSCGPGSVTNLAGFPGALCWLVETAGRKDLAELGVRRVWTAGEQLTAGMRKQLAQAFAAPVFDFYGMHECVLAAWECRTTGLYHVADHAVALEVLRGGRAVASGEEGEVVITALHSYAMPFIRYRTGDLAVRGPARCPCGAPYSTLEKIVGRRYPTFDVGRGRRLHVLTFVTPLVHSVPWVRRYQVVQTEEASFDVAVVCETGTAPAADEVQRLRAEMAARAGEGIRVGIRLVPTLEPGASGKTAPFIAAVHRAYP